MRGKQGIVCAISRSKRLIPAHAGKTPSHRVYHVFPTAHPRACGENREIEFGGWYEQGSSPRMRGKPCVIPALPKFDGLIPAHAGKTRERREPWRCRRAHPRACGENATSDAYLAPDGGSSPRMRGKLDDARPCLRRGGLIPAHAGKTRIENRFNRCPKAHPRACGENLCQLHVAHAPTGSSPRMRGKLVIILYYVCQVGLIPAHAGKTQRN